MSNALNVVNKFFPMVKKVKDATKRLDIEVLDKDVKNSKLKDHNNCALAVACKRKLHCDGVIISISSAYVINGDEAVRYRLPQSARREIVSFDRNAGFEPGEYSLVPSSPTNRIGAPQSKRKHSGPSGRGPKVQHITKNVRARI